MRLRFLPMYVCFIIFKASKVSFCERTRHGSNHHQDLDISKSSIDDIHKTAYYHNCPNCLHHKSDKDIKVETDRLRLEAIKRQILSKLGMREKPNITHPLPRELVEKTYRTISGESLEEEEESGKSSNFDFVETDEEDVGKTSEIIAFAEQGYRLNGNRLLEFRINHDLNTGHEYRVKTATLWIKADLVHPRRDKCRTTSIYVFKFRSMIGTDVILTSQQFNEVTEDPTSVTLDESKAGWQKIDVLSTVETFLKRPSALDTLKLFVDCSCCGNWRVHVPNGNRERRSDPNRPFLAIKIEPGSPKRIRRRSMECSADSGNQCCKQQFYVSFEKLGWREWIIAPSGYFANYCRGECGFHRTPDTYVNYHTHVIEQFRKNYHLSGMQPCCAPLKFSSISLIYYDTQHNIIKRDLPKMVVDDCGCP